VTPNSNALVHRFRSSNHIDINLVQRSALLRASRRTATSEVVPAAILRDARQGGAVLWMRSVGSEFHPSDLIGFMESIRQDLTAARSRKAEQSIPRTSSGRQRDARNLSLSGIPRPSKTWPITFATPTYW